MTSVAPVMAQARGGLSLSPHDAPEQKLRTFEKNDRDRRMREDPPNVELKPTTRVFRVPDKFPKFVTKIVRATKDSSGNELSPASSLVIQFLPCAAVERCGEIILDSSKPDDRERIAYIEGLMETDKHLGIFDFLAGRAEAERARLTDDARKLTDPGHFEGLLIRAQELGLDVAGSMAAAVSKLKRPAPKTDTAPKTEA